VTVKQSRAAANDGVRIARSGDLLPLVATSRGDHRSPRSGPAVLHSQWDWELQREAFWCPEISLFVRIRYSFAYSPRLPCANLGGGWFSLIQAFPGGVGSDGIAAHWRRTALAHASFSILLQNRCR
jgi:hypothetical protein